MDSRFKKICRRRTPSPMRYSWATSWTRMRKLCPRSLVWERMMLSTWPTCSARLMESWFRATSLDSILLMSSTSLTRLSRWRLDMRTFSI